MVVGFAYPMQRRLPRQQWHGSEAAAVHHLVAAQLPDAMLFIASQPTPCRFRTLNEHEDGYMREGGGRPPQEPLPPSTLSQTLGL